LRIGNSLWLRIGNSLWLRVGNLRLDPSIRANLGVGHDFFGGIIFFYSRPCLNLAACPVANAKRSTIGGVRGRQGGTP